MHAETRYIGSLDFRSWEDFANAAAVESPLEFGWFELGIGEVGTSECTRFRALIATAQGKHNARKANPYDPIILVSSFEPSALYEELDAAVEALVGRDWDDIVQQVQRTMYQEGHTRFISFGKSGRGARQDYDPVRKAVFHHLFGWSTGDVTFLGIEHGEDPSDELLAYFAREMAGITSVRPVSAVISSSAWQFMERGTKRTGIVLEITSIEEVNPLSYEVIAVRNAGTLASSGCRYALKYQRGEWKVTSEALVWIS